MCTRAMWTTPGGVTLVGRSMDWAYDTGTNIWALPAGVGRHAGQHDQHPHNARIDYLSVEACVNTMGLRGSPGGNFKVDVGLIDNESTGAIFDGNSLICGTVIVGKNQTPAKASTSTFPFTNWLGSGSGGTQMTLINRDITTGAIASPPTVPSTTVALQNQFLRNCAVVVTAGSGSTCAVAVDGGALCTIAASAIATVMVPAGRTITPTYTSAPTWAWTAL
jgi:hypothetical protein